MAVRQITVQTLPMSSDYGGCIGETFYFSGDNSGMLTNPNGIKTLVENNFTPKASGFYTLKLDNGGTADFFAYENLEELLTRTTDAIAEPYHCDFNLCEGSMWLWALLIRKKLLGTAGVNEYRFREFLEENVYISEESVSNNDIGKIVPFPHSFGGKKYSPYHLYKINRIQNSVVQSEIMLEAYKAYRDPEYLRLAKEYADNLIRDHLTQEGALCCDWLGDVGIDYTTVTACILCFVDLYRCLKSTSEGNKYKETSIAIADHLLRRGLNFPTEGTGGRREMEEGSISCTALSLVYAYKYVESKPEYLDFAEELLNLHDAWTLLTPHATQFYSTIRWWEANWEGDADGSSINAGHAWTIWKAEANFHYALLKADFKRLIDSYNGYLTNFSKVRNDGRMYTCFCPDYIPSIPYKIKHSFPDLTDGSMPYYVWCRSEDTWFKTSALYCDEFGNHCLNGALEEKEGITYLKTGAIKLEQLFLEGITEKVVIETPKPIKIICRNFEKFKISNISAQKEFVATVIPVSGKITIENIK